MIKYGHCMPFTICPLFLEIKQKNQPQGLYSYLLVSQSFEHSIRIHLSLMDRPLVRATILGTMSDSSTRQNALVIS